MSSRWNEKDTRTLQSLCKRNLFATEIAERMDKRAGTVRYQMRRLGIEPNKRSAYRSRIGKSNAKHSHLREKAMIYFLTHTFEETMAKFGLTRSELKSLQTVAYRDPTLSHLRKDTRRNDPWSFDETMFLLRAAGLQQRTWIAKKLNRGGVHAVKEMVNRLNTNTRYINGIPRKWAEDLLGKEIEGHRVKAGPKGRGFDGRPIIVPWVVLYSEAKRSPGIPPHICRAIGAMARFQKRIHGTRGIQDTVASIEKIIRRRA